MKQLNSELILLAQFNRREAKAFEEVYMLYFDELHRFASRLFYGLNVDVCDILQDIFLAVWEKRNREFNNLCGIKAYLYVCIKNALKNHINHSKYVNAYQKTFLDEKQYIVVIAENEIASMISHVSDMLPEECYKVFKLHVEGWDIKEIATKLNKAEATVYKQRSKAISILSKKLFKQIMFYMYYSNF